MQIKVKVIKGKGRGNCKECPYIIRNRHNDMIISFAERSGKKHNCHMKSGKKDLWTITDEKLMCKGKK